MPSGTEADPSVLLALAVPLMFGYMFGDVGQGLVIAAAGFALRRRWPLARLFIAGGLSAAFLVGGALLLAGGLLLAAAQAHWRGEFGTWLGTDAGLLVCYLGTIVGLVWTPAWLAAGAGALWFCLGHGVHRRSVAAVATALAEGVERLLQILINTLSFARVGAFALAHAGLSSAIVALMDAAGHPVAAATVLALPPPPSSFQESPS